MSPKPTYEELENKISILEQESTRQKENEKIYIARLQSAENELIKAHEELEVLIDQRTADLLKSNQQLNKEIEERKKMESELRAGEERFKTIFENSSDVIILTDTEGVVLDANDKVEEVLGYSPEEVIGKNYTELNIFDPEKLKISKQHLSKALKGNPGCMLEYEVISKNGTRSNIEVNSRLLKKNGEIKGIINNIRDITARRRAEELWERYRELIESINQGLYSVDQNGIFTFVSPTVETLTGYPPKEMVGRPFTDFIFPEDLPSLMTLSEDILSGSVITSEHRFARKSGEISWVNTSVKSVQTDTDEMEIHGLFTDITERKMAEKALRESEKRFRQITDNMTDMVSMVDMDMVYQYVSPSAVKILGYTQEEMLGTSIYEYVHKDDLLGVANAVERSILTASAGRQRFRYRHANGDYLWIDTNGVLIIDDDMKFLGAVFGARDITKQKKAEEELQKTNRALEKSLKTLREAQHYVIQTEKMASLGRLVAGVAHEINTPLGIGLTASSFLRDQTADFYESYTEGRLIRKEFENYLRKSLEASSIIYSNLNRAADLVGSFKLVAVDQSEESARIFNIKEYIESILNSLKPKYKGTCHNINVNCPHNLAINSFPGCFSQILTNFLMNSLIHGFEGVDQGTILIDVSANNYNLLLNYSDNGRGMSDEILEKIFEPFFTTNRSNGGTGLGMHIVYNIVYQKLNGQIECWSKPDHGANFSITIPLNAN